MLIANFSSSIRKEFFIIHLVNKVEFLNSILVEIKFNQGENQFIIVLQRFVLPFIFFMSKKEVELLRRSKYSRKHSSMDIRKNFSNKLITTYFLYISGGDTGRNNPRTLLLRNYESPVKVNFRWVQLYIIKIWIYILLFQFWLQISTKYKILQNRVNHHNFSIKSRWKLQ